MSASFNQITTANLPADMAIADTTPGEIVLVDSPAKKSTLKTTLPTHLLLAVILLAPLVFLGAIAAVLLTKTIRILLSLLLDPSTSPTITAAHNQMSRLE